MILQSVHSRKPNRIQAKQKALVGVILVALAQQSVAAAAIDDSAGEAFDARFTGLGEGQVDISRFGRSGAVLPGVYRLDIYLNDDFVRRADVTFIDRPASEAAAPCVTRSLLEEMGVALEPEDAAVVDSECLEVSQIIAGAAVVFDAGGLRLDLSVPQVSVVRQARGYVSPDQWESGMPAGTISYSFNASRVKSVDGVSSASAYLGLNAGLNLGGWRVRTRGSLSWLEQGGRQWQSIGAFAQREFPQLRSQLTIGDSFTSGDLFQSVGYRGARIASDDRMLPDSQVGYAPVVRGTADTRASVEIRQGDYLIYQSTVPAGAFEINDLYATGYGGDLEVTVKEADGRIRTFRVPYSAVSSLLRPGHSRYSATLGEVRTGSSGEQLPLFGEATYQRGLNNWLTGYGGIQATDSSLYLSAMLGAAVNTPLGAMSVDITGSRVQLADGVNKLSGHSVRIAYSKAIPSTRTNFALAAYRYSSDKYLDLTDAVELTRTADQEVTGRTNVRDRLQLNLSQGLGDGKGSFFATGAYSTYRGRAGGDNTFQFGYTNSAGRLRYGLNAGRTYAGDHRKDTQYQLTLSVPLDAVRDSRPPMFTASASGGSQGPGGRVAVNGLAGRENQFDYGIAAATVNGRGTDVDGAVNWHAPYATVGASQTWSQSSMQSALTASGGVVVHGGGITLAQRLGDTIGVLEAKGAEGARVANGSQIKVDQRGYAVVSDLVPYRINNVELDPAGMSMDVELKSTRVKAVPSAGAVLPIRFDTTSGRAVLIDAKLTSGEILPFAAQVLNASGVEVGVVGQGGRIFARNGEDGGVLTVKWGEDPSMRCSISYELPQRGTKSEVTGLVSLSSICQES